MIVVNFTIHWWKIIIALPRGKYLQSMLNGIYLIGIKQNVQNADLAAIVNSLREIYKCHYVDNFWIVLNLENRLFRLASGSCKILLRHRRWFQSICSSENQCTIVGIRINRVQRCTKLAMLPLWFEYHSCWDVALSNIGMCPWGQHCFMMIHDSFCK